MSPNYNQLFPNFSEVPNTSASIFLTMLPSVTNPHSQIPELGWAVGILQILFSVLNSTLYCYRTEVKLTGNAEAGLLYLDGLT